MMQLGIILLFISSVVCQESDIDSIIAWSHELDLGGGVQLRWSNENPSFITMEMSAPTQGWVGIGFSPNGGMKDSDIVIGWVDLDGTPHLMDMFGVRNETPQLDPVQDYTLLMARETEERTSIRFKRPWNTCDDKDFVLNNDTTRIIWAWNENDPAPSEPPGKFTPFYHGTNRGVKTTLVRAPPSHAKFPDSHPDLFPDTKQWDAFMDNNKIEGEDDVFFCKIIKFPDAKTKHHLIGYRPLLVEENKGLIHHIIIYECHVPLSDGNSHDIFEKHTKDPGGRCYGPEMPPEWGKYCINIPVLWTSGSEGDMFPSDLGMPLGEEHDGTTYFMFEIHYDNPQFTTFEDNSGFRLFYTDNLREHELGALAVGHKVSPFHVVPPGLDSFTSFGLCTTECTSQTLPDDGISVSSVLLHAHYAGKKITLHHIRDGKELEPLGQDNSYDYNYQQARTLSPPRKILPGDQLITECVYDTSKKNKPSFGGLGTRDEMCLSFLYVYPRPKLTDCKSMPEFHSFLKGIGVGKVEGEILEEINMPYVPKVNQAEDYPDNPFYLKNSTYERPLNALDALLIVEDESSSAEGLTVGDLIRNLEWDSRGRDVEKAWNEGKLYAFCSGSNRERFPLQDYIVSLPQYQEFIVVDECQTLKNQTQNSEPQKKKPATNIQIILPVNNFVGSQVPFRPSSPYPDYPSSPHNPQTPIPSHHFTQAHYPFLINHPQSPQSQQYYQQPTPYPTHQQQYNYPYGQTIYNFHQFQPPNYPRPFYTLIPRPVYPLYYPSSSPVLPQSYSSWRCWYC